MTDLLQPLWDFLPPIGWFWALTVPISLLLIWLTRSKEHKLVEVKIEAPSRLKIPPLVPYRRYLQPILDLAYLQSMSIGVEKPLKSTEDLVQLPQPFQQAETAPKPEVQSETEAKAWYDDKLWDVEFWIAFAIARAKLDAKDRGTREAEAVKTALDEYDHARKHPIKRRKRAVKGKSKAKGKKGSK